MRLRIGPSREVVCRQAVELVTDYLEGALSRGGRRRFEAHLTQCPHCREYLAQLRATISLTGTVRPDDLPPPRCRTTSSICAGAGGPIRMRRTRHRTANTVTDCHWTFTCSSGGGLPGAAP